jgi:hypothetical protein
VAQPLGPISISAEIGVANSASLAVTIDPIVAQISIKAKAGDGYFPRYPWWWAAYCDRIASEKEAARLLWIAQHTFEAEGWGLVPSPIGRGQAFSDPNWADEEFIAAMLLLWRRAA